MVRAPQRRPRGTPAVHRLSAARRVIRTLTHAAVVLALLDGVPATGQTGRPTTGIPTKSPLENAAAAPRRFKAAVDLVRLSSCDPAVRAKRRPRLEDVAETAERSRARADLKLYHEMLGAYANGDEAASVEAVVELDPERLDRVLRNINDPLDDPVGLWDAKRYSLAVMLHTDAAFRLAGASYGNAMYDQMQIAADLLQLGVRCAPDSLRPLAPRWYVALSRVLGDRTVFGAAEALLELGRTRLVDDPAILRESGLLAESLGTLFVLAGGNQNVSLRGGAPGILRRIVDRRRAWLEDAEEWLGRAAVVEPGSDEVLLHLGRVQALRFDDAEALRTLGTVLARTRSAETAYLAGIFIGAVHDRGERLDEAASAYRAAARYAPGAHAAEIGLADVLRRSGRLDESRETLFAMVTRPDRDSHDPLWWYSLDPPGRADERLTALRDEVRR